MIFAIWYKYHVISDNSFVLILFHSFEMYLSFS